MYNGIIFDEARAFNDDLACVKMGIYWGIINKAMFL
jgi:hypothetical protein